MPRLRRRLPRRLLAPALGWRFSYEVAMSEQAANVLLPTGGAGGLALGAWALRRIGMPAERIGRRTVAFFLVTSSINFVAVVVAGVGLGARRAARRGGAGVAADPGRRRGAVLIGDRACCPALLDGSDSAGGGGRIRDALVAGRGHLAGGIRDAISLLGSGRPSVTLGADRLHGARRGRAGARLRRARRRRAAGRRLRARLRGRPARRARPAPRRRRRHRRRPDPGLRPARDPGRDRRRRGDRLPRLPARRPGASSAWRRSRSCAALARSREDRGRGRSVPGRRRRRPPGRALPRRRRWR